MTGATVMFGIGATKAGTSWLHRYLASHPDCRMPSVKEIHYFDALDGRSLPAEIGRFRLLRLELAARIAKGEPGLEPRVAELDRWIALFERGAEGEGDYLPTLLAGAEGGVLTGDVTPAYGLLSEDRLAAMARLPARVRFVYLLRDPVDRLWSNIRMLAGNKGQTAGRVQRRANRMFDSYAAGEKPEVARRSDYAATLARLARAVDPSQVLVEFYERLFSAEAIARLCAFLGIRAVPGDYGRRVHESAPAVLDDGRRAVAQRLLAPQYDYVHRLFGDLPERWQANMVKV